MSTSRATRLDTRRSPAVEQRCVGHLVGSEALVRAGPDRGSVVGRRARRPPARRQLQGRVLRQDRGLHAPQRRPRFRPEFLGQQRPDAASGGERVGLPTGSVERQHQQAPPVLPQRVVGDQPLELRQHLGVPAQLEPRLAGGRPRLRRAPRSAAASRSRRTARPASRRRARRATGRRRLAAGARPPRVRRRRAGRDRGRRDRRCGAHRSTRDRASGRSRSRGGPRTAPWSPSAGRARANCAAGRRGPAATCARGRASPSQRVSARESVLTTPGAPTASAARSSRSFAPGTGTGARSSVWTSSGPRTAMRMGRR